jgi:metal-responsive CopG/Arc/MetJ family transcriptional regulator
MNMEKEVFLPVRIEREMLKELTQLGEKHGYKSRSELVREAIGDKITQLRGEEIVKIRKISKSKAKKEILAYIRNKDRVYASDIAFDLRLDFGFVFEIIDELFKEKKVEEAS